MIYFSEFVEFISLNEEDLNHDNVEDKAYKSSPSRKELNKDIKNSPLKKSNSKSDLVKKSLDETMQNYETEEEREKRLQEEQEKDQRKEVQKHLDYEHNPRDSLN